MRAWAQAAGLVVGATGAVLAVLATFPRHTSEPVRPKAIPGRVFVVVGPGTSIPLRDGGSAMVGVALILGPKESLGATEIDSGSGIRLPADAAMQRRAQTVRVAVLRALGRLTVARLRSAKRRAAALREVRRSLRARYRVDVRRVVLSDLALP